jgi:hypothetical protein
MAFIINHVKVFSIQSNCLRLFGIGMSSDYTFRPYQLCLAIINIAYIIIVISCEFRFTITSSDLQSLIANSYVLLTRVLVTVKIAIMIWKRKDLQKLTQTLLDMIGSDTDATSKLINRRMAKLEHKCMAGMLFAIQVTLLLVLATPKTFTL